MSTSPHTEAESMYANSMMAMMQQQIEQAQTEPLTGEELKRKEDAEYDHLMEYYMAKMNRKQRRAYKANLRQLEKQEAREARNKR